MAAQSFPLIGIDYSGNQYEREWTGINAKDAAKRLAAAHNYAEVKSNDKSHRLARYREPLFKSPSKRSNQALLGILLDNLLVKTGPKIIEHLRNKGMSVSLVSDNGKLSLKVDYPITLSVTTEDREALRDFVQPHKASIIAALQAEEAAKKAPQAEEKPAGIHKGKPQRDIVLSMLPQMPTPFTRQDFTERLKAAGYSALAADTKKIVSALYYCARPGGETNLLGAGKFEVLEQFRHRKPIAEPVTVTPPPVEVPTPPVEPPPVMAEPAAPEPIESTVEAPAPVNPLAAILDLASQAMAGTDTGEELAAKLTEACELFEIAQLEAVGALTAQVKSIADKLKQQHAARYALARTLTG